MKKTVKSTTTKKQKDKQVRVLDDKDLARTAGGDGTDENQPGNEMVHLA